MLSGGLGQERAELGRRHPAEQCRHRQHHHRHQRCHHKWHHQHQRCHNQHLVIILFNGKGFARKEKPIRPKLSSIITIPIIIILNAIIIYVTIRVAELGSLSSGAKMAMKIFVKRVFSIFASNASFLRVIASLQIQLSKICNLYHVIVHFLPKKHCF